MAELIERLRLAMQRGELQLPVPGAGLTRQRHAALMEFGRKDLSFARLAEAHTDATAILAEADRQPRSGALYGVWAAEGPGSTVQLSRGAGDTWRLQGAKRYCSGAPLLDAALVTVRYRDSSAMLDVPLNAAGLRIDDGGWSTPAFAETRTATVTFDAVELPHDCLIATEDWYLRRAGFWHGAIGPASCWAGGAIGLVEAARALGRRDPHSQAQLGALAANAWAFAAVLNQAGDEIDAAAKDSGSQARFRALQVRHLIERLCTDTLDRFGRATGPQLLAFDQDAARRYSELTLYIRQCHAERDLQAMLSAD
ncbi:MAG: hypothetical protein SXG53_21820 [Pseudomonadota bacterium]|nr:hypothetical protein [Pseudomonadota bacterium]